MTRARSYGPAKRNADQRRTAAVQLVTMRRTLDNFTAEDLARATGISVPEAHSLLERERLMRGARGHG